MFARSAAAVLIACAATAGYLGWVFAGRHGQTRSFERGAARAERARYAKPAADSSTLKIAAFYGSPPFLVRGERAVICYGVENARAVRIDPPIEELKPAANRCLAAEPRETTRYTLTAVGENGERVSHSFTLTVEPPAPFFTLLATGPAEIEPGDRYAFCYGVTNATRVRLDPQAMPLPPVHPKHCVQLGVAKSTEFRLTAWGEDGRAVSERFAVKVR